ncbi:hypothetical protein LOAG_09371 [Loa loa]|uniref:Uncharacterized protein n=1 Tax=Loa loa TaxID=7209 RepID=A0A1S0TRV5_LOALO|nr:hypothetical protein LOAG_09371 [Loa loa]EFO19122.1 hypothetical protein LOAG_09371 [Loa loa]
MPRTRKLNQKSKSWIYEIQEQSTRAILWIKKVSNSRKEQGSPINCGKLGHNSTTTGVVEIARRSSESIIASIQLVKCIAYVDILCNELSGNCYDGFCMRPIKIEKKTTHGLYKTEETICESNTTRMRRSS